MANINTQTLFDQKVKAFGATEDSDAWQTAFMLALQLVCADVRIICHGSYDTPTDWTEDLALDADYYSPVISAGLDYYIDVHGDWMRKPPGDLYAVYLNSQRNASLYYMRDVNDTDEAKLGDLTD